MSSYRNFLFETEESIIEYADQINWEDFSVSQDLLLMSDAFLETFKYDIYWHRFFSSHCESGVISTKTFDRFLKASGWDINTEVLYDEDYTSMLIIALYNENEQLAEHLIYLGADVNYQDKEDDSPFIISMRHGAYDIVNFLMDKGLDMHTTFDGDTVLTNLIEDYEGEIAILKLIEKALVLGSDPNQRDSEGDTYHEYLDEREDKGHLYNLLVKYGMDEEGPDEEEDDDECFDDEDDIEDSAHELIVEEMGAFKEYLRNIISKSFKI